MLSVRDAILDALAELPAGSTCGIDELERATEERRPGKTSGRDVRSRLVALRHEGVVERLKRGQYQLARGSRQWTALEQRALEILNQAWRPEALARLVLWDATPYLELSEDGAPGQRIVIEHEEAGSLREAIQQAWPERPVQWSVKGHGPLDGRLLEPDRQAGRIDMGIILVERERIGASVLTPEGVRAPTQERIALEFMGMDEAPDVGAAVTQALLLRSELDHKRLWQAATAIGKRTDLTTTLAVCYDRLPLGLQQDYRKQMPAVAALLMEERA